MKDTEFRSASKREEDARLLCLEASPFPAWIMDMETLAFLSVNEAALRLYGYGREEFLGMTALEIRPEEDKASYRDSLRETAGRLPSGEPEPARFFKHRKKDFTLIDVEENRTNLLIEKRPATIVFAQDVTERKTAEEQLRRAQRMEAVSRLAGGIAHDFNNILTAILGFSELVISRLPESDPLRKPLGEIKKAGERAAELTRQMLAFSRRQLLAPQLVDLNLVVSGLERNLTPMLGEEIILVTELGLEIGIVSADPGQIEEIIFTLAANAREAMPSGGTFSIQTRSQLVDEAFTRGRYPLSIGRYIVLTLSDTGRGIDEEVRAHLFEPFYTTKRPGHGTGMGLATVYGIVKQSNGFIWVSSKEGKGTTFEIFLPEISREAAGQTPMVARGLLAKTVCRSILVVEDEEMVRTLVQTLLVQQGHIVRVARNGNEALQILADPALHLDLLLTDVVMRGMSGPELAQQAVIARPGLRVLFMSGYTDKGIVREGVLEPGLAFLQKPFTLEALVQKIREAFSPT